MIELEKIIFTRIIKIYIVFTQNSVIQIYLAMIQNKYVHMMLTRQLNLLKYISHSLTQLQVREEILLSKLSGQEKDKLIQWSHDYDIALKNAIIYERRITKRYSLVLSQPSQRAEQSIHQSIASDTMMTVSTTQILAQDIPIAPLSQQNISNPQLIQYPQNLHIYKDFQEEKKSELIEERKAQIPPTTIPQNSPAQMVSTIQNHRNLPCFKFGIQQCQNFDMIFQKWHTKNPLEEEKEGLNDSQIIGQLKESENDVSIDGPLQIQSLHQARFLKQDSKPNSNFSGATPSTQGSSGMGPLSDLTSQLMMPPPQLSQKEKEDVRQEQQRRKMMQAQIKKHPFEVKPMSRGFDRLNLETSAMYQSRDSTFKGQLPRINQASNFITQVEEVLNKYQIIFHRDGRN